METREVIELSRQSALTPEAEAELRKPSFRERIYRELHSGPTREDRNLLLRMLNLEAKYRSDDSNDGEHFENLYWCGLLLHQVMAPEDALPMWSAKHVNFDTGCGFDIQFLVGAGVDETLLFLRGVGDTSASKAADYIDECREAGDFDDLPSWLEDRIRYFA